jgi:hypothetical protein
LIPPTLQSKLQPAAVNSYVHKPQHCIHDSSVQHIALAHDQTCSTSTIDGLASTRTCQTCRRRVYACAEPLPLSAHTQGIKLPRPIYTDDQPHNRTTQPDVATNVARKAVRQVHCSCACNRAALTPPVSQCIASRRKAQPVLKPGCVRLDQSEAAALCVLPRKTDRMVACRQATGSKCETSAWRPSRCTQCLPSASHRIQIQLCSCVCRAHQPTHSLRACAMPKKAWSNQPPAGKMHLGYARHTQSKTGQ